MQRRQRRRFAAPPPDRHQRLALVQHILLNLVQAGHRQLPRLFVCAIMGHQKELLSALQRSFERIVLLFCSFGNPLSYFVGVNAHLSRPYAVYRAGRKSVSNVERCMSMVVSIGEKRGNVNGGIILKVSLDAEMKARRDGSWPVLRYIHPGSGGAAMSLATTCRFSRR